MRGFDTGDAGGSASESSDARSAGDVSALHAAAAEFSQHLGSLKSRLTEAKVDWYPYDTLANLAHFDDILSDRRRDLLRLADGEPVVDIGGADGELAFVMERAGAADVDFVDHAPTNYNGMRGVHALRQALSSTLTIADIDLDERFSLPRERYGLAFFLGVLYHLKNPYAALEHLARHARWALISTRIARYTADKSVLLRDQPLAYLLDWREANDDPTNYWIFSELGLRRLLGRCGWLIMDFGTVGNTTDSDPASPTGDERAFLVAQSTKFEGSTGSRW